MQHERTDMSLESSDSNGHNYISEKGPWTVQVWDFTDGSPSKVVLQSDDFNHDAALIITGDFISHGQMLKYANALADRMNKMPLE